MAKQIIFTDLDGTLLHPRTYSFAAAIPAMALAAAQGVHVVFCSSKTRTEIEELRRQCRNKSPFIYENGGGLVIPSSAQDFLGHTFLADERQPIALGRPYSELRQALLALRERLGIQVVGFGDLSVAEIGAATGLSTPQATLAQQREFDEPFFFEPGETRVQEFLRAVEATGLRWTQGGRFYHLHGDTDKGRAVRMLTRFYVTHAGRCESIGLGDSLNDLTMLQAVDRPFLVQREGGTFDERISLPHLVRVPGVGPEGWNQVVLRILS